VDVVETILDGNDGEAIVVVTDEELHPDALSESLSERGIFVATIYIQEGDTDEIALRLLGQAFRFPGYYGMNWNAADECLQDMSWQEAKGYVCLLLPRTIVGPPSQQIIDDFVTTFGYAEKFWRERDRVCALVLFPPFTSG
jgi:hypothetical protein